MKSHPAEVSDEDETGSMTTTHDAVTAEDGGEDWVTKLLRTVESQASKLGETANGFSKLTKHTFLLHVAGVAGRQLHPGDRDQSGRGVPHLQGGEVQGRRAGELSFWTNIRVRSYLVLCYSSACGRCFVCFVVGPCTLTGSKTKHTKHLPQADE